VSNVVREAVQAVRLGAQEKSLHLESSISPSTAAVLGNEISFKEALINLLLNGIKYTPAWGTISVRMGVRAESVIVEVADTGIGIPQDEQARIFEEFYRASNARHIECDGDGLGLSLVKRVVELHGGTIDFSSELGRGTVFRITLPVIAPESSAESISQDAVHPGRKGTLWSAITCLPHE
jgi:signal transduction histidine kinase